MISASQLDRASACPASEALRVRVSESGEYAERGIQIHEFLRRICNDASDRAALDCVPLEWRKTCEQLDLATALHQIVVLGTEQAYTVDANTGYVTYLGNNIGRDYAGQSKSLYNRELFPSETCLTLDVEGRFHTGIPTALDWKSGSPTKPVAQMWQMRLQSYALAIKHDAPEVLARVVYIAEDGSVDLDECTFSRMDLDDIPEELRGIQARLNAARAEYAGGKLPVLYPGDHCRYCPVLRGCPAQADMLRTALLELPSDTSILTQQQVYAAFKKLKAIKPLLKKADDALKLMLEQYDGKVVGDDGYAYSRGWRSKTYIPAELVRGLLIKYNVPLNEVSKIIKTTKYPIVRRVKHKP